MKPLTGSEPIAICCLLLDQVEIETFESQFWIDRCHAGAKVSDRSIGDPLLSPVDPPASIHFGRQRSRSTQVRTGLVFREADGSDFFAFDCRDEVPLFDVLVSKPGDEVSSHENLHDRRHGKSTGSPCQFLIEDHLGEGIRRHSTILFFMPQAQISQCSEFFPEVPGGFFFFIQFSHTGHDQAIDCIPNHLSEELLFLGKSKIKRHESCSFRRNSSEHLVRSSEYPFLNLRTPNSEL